MIFQLSKAESTDHFESLPTSISLLILTTFFLFYSNSKASNFNTGRRFKDAANGKPGPGAYEETGKISSGKQVCSNFHSTRIKNMGTTEPRTQWGGNPRFRTPAPGTYRPPSDFGYLEFKS